MSKSNFNQLKEVIHFIWTQRKYLGEKGKNDLAIKLLIRIYESILKLHDDKIKRNLFSDLSRWVIYITKFDDKLYNAFLEIAKCSSDHFNTINLVEGLSNIVENSPKEVANILLTVIKHDERYPYYKEEVITKIFDEMNKIKVENKIVKIGKC